MFGLTGKRTALARSKCLSLRTIPRKITPQQLSLTNIRDFNSTPTMAAFRPTWMPMRVKTPWIDALTQSREAARNATDGTKEGPATPSAKPDPTPKKMSDSYYSAVRTFKHPRIYSTAVLINYRSSLWHKTNGSWTTTSMHPGTSVSALY